MAQVGFWKEETSQVQVIRMHRVRRDVSSGTSLDGPQGMASGSDCPRFDLPLEL